MRRKKAQVELNSSQQALNEWVDVFRHGAWKKLVAYLEAEYVNAMAIKPTSLAELRERQGRAEMVRDIFTFIRHDFNERNALTNELRTMYIGDEMLPDKEVFI
jgi:hypothetical protein